MQNRPGQEFQHAVIDWYRENGREFFWRNKCLSPFELLITELLLKRTQAERVDRIGEDILAKLSDPERVLKVDRRELEEILEPLGLQKRRSKNIQAACRDLVEKYDGEIPADRDKLLEIRSVGEYAADSIMCIEFNKPVLVLDTNVIAVAEHYLDLEPPSDPRLDDTIRPALEPLVPEENPEEFNWGLLDVGAALRRDDYECPNCPLDYPCTRVD